MTVKAPQLQYCWLLLHPKHGWCGGAEDEWSDDESVVKRNASFCKYETKIVSREKPLKQRHAPPGSVRPSIRGTFQ